jgi:hypothetical protein
MKLLPLLSVATALSLGALPGSAQSPVAPRYGDHALEAGVEFAYAGKSDLAEGSRSLGEISTRQTRISAVRTLAIDAQSAWIVGGAWQQFAFSPAAGVPIPERLTALSLKLGYNRQLDPRWTLRTEIDPGFYGDSDRSGSGAFNAPLGVRFLYGASRDLQWLFGVNVDLRSSHPVIGGPGLRWQFAPDWTLLLIVPAPRIEYAVNRQVTLFAGMNLRGGTFRVADDFGRRRGRPALDRQDISYRELTAGAGVRWNLGSGLALNAGAGWMFDRRFEFDDRDLLLNGDGAPLLQLTLTGRF